MVAVQCSTLLSPEIPQGDLTPFHPEVLTVHRGKVLFVTLPTSLTGGHAKWALLPTAKQPPEELILGSEGKPVNDSICMVFFHIFSNSRSSCCSNI
ncbi:hypothetical protein JZ751_020015 [Albula glossodonta]|uniref:Uncharacterized protein n=1 Tax=Albula glossodonta TaxID=121402 RepID=A0A8T2NJE6_9TELE|nr:hypothetical protein JZ751_020015 [Albula glossodonta]